MWSMRVKKAAGQRAAGGDGVALITDGKSSPWQLMSLPCKMKTDPINPLCFPKAS